MDMNGLCLIVGWPDSFKTFSKIMKKNDIKIADIKYLIVSHFHMDHAGLAQLLRNYGITLLLHEVQNGAVQTLNNFFIKKPNKLYVPIINDNNNAISSFDSVNILKGLGIDGRIVPTPGHSPDSISLIINNECAFIGDLPTLEIAYGLNDPKTLRSWNDLLSFNIKTVYPAHSNTFMVNK